MRLLFLSHRLPYAPNRGDRVRAYFLLRTLSQVADVHVVSLVHDAEEAAQAAQMTSLVASVQVARIPRFRRLVASAAALPTPRPLTHTMLDSPALLPALEATMARSRPDVVVAYCSGMARLAVAPPLSGIPFVLDMVDVDSAKWDALANVTAPPMRWIYGREARLLRRFEATSSAAAVVTTVVTAREAATLRTIAPDADVEVVPNGVDVTSLRPNRPPSTARAVVFCGVMNYAPNVEAARLLARDVWPLVRQRHADATLTIVGSHPTRAVQALADASKGIVVTGAVPDVRPYLWEAAMAAAPIVTARGIQNKVLEAVAAGLPTVVTPNIMESLPPSLAPACVAADGATAIAEAISTLLSLSPEARRAVAENADVDPLRWERQLLPFQSLVARAADTRGPRR